MTSTNLDYSNPSFKGFDETSRKDCIIEIDNDGPLLYLSLGKVGRGGQGLGRKNRIFHIYIDKKNQAHAGLICKDDGGQFYRYVEFGTAKTAGEDL